MAVAVSKSTSKRVAIQRTHWATCWKDPAHHECAVARAEKLERERDTLMRLFGGVDSVLAHVANERAAQQFRNGWTPEHDDEHSDFELLDAAIAYARSGRSPGLYDKKEPLDFPEGWVWKPKGWRRDLIRAAALIVAEIERRDRAER